MDQRREADGFHQLECCPADVMAELDRRHKPYGDFCRPQLALIAMARRGALVASIDAAGAARVTS